MARTASVELEQGVAGSRARGRRAELRAVTGDDELALAEFEASGARVHCMAARSTELLLRTVASLDDRPGAGRDDIRSLSIGDRERLLLALFALSFGPTPELSAVCGRCSERLELPVDVTDLIVPPSSGACLEHAEDVGGTQVRFRLPTGKDQEAVADLALADPEAAALLLLQRCLIDASGVDAGLLRKWMADRLVALDPQAETIVEADCPACGAPARVLVDAGPLLFAQVASMRRLMAEVDRIARVYHWSESAILALPAARRRQYLELIDAAEPANG